ADAGDSVQPRDGGHQFLSCLYPSSGGGWHHRQTVGVDTHVYGPYLPHGFPVLCDGAGSSPRGRALPGGARRDTGDLPIRPCLGVLRGQQGQPPMTHRDRTQSHHRGAKTGVRRAGHFRLRRSLASMMRHVLLVAVTIAFLVPFYWMVISALKDNNQIFAQPLQWWPNPVRWNNVRR